MLVSVFNTCDQLPRMLRQGLANSRLAWTAHQDTQSKDKNKYLVVCCIQFQKKKVNSFKIVWFLLGPKGLNLFRLEHLHCWELNSKPNNQMHHLEYTVFCPTQHFTTNICFPLSIVSWLKVLHKISFVLEFRWIEQPWIHSNQLSGHCDREESGWWRHISRSCSYSPGWEHGPTMWLRGRNRGQHWQAVKQLPQSPSNQSRTCVPHPWVTQEHLTPQQGMYISATCLGLKGILGVGA